MCLRLIAETDARSVGDSHPSCYKRLNAVIQQHGRPADNKIVYLSFYLSHAALRRLSYTVHDSITSLTHNVRL